MSFGAEFNAECYKSVMSMELSSPRADLTWFQWNPKASPGMGLVWFKANQNAAYKVQYVQGRVLNSGSFGVVYLYAPQTPGDRERHTAVAVKITKKHDEHEVRFLRDNQARTNVIGGRILYTDSAKDVIVMEKATHDLFSLQGFLSVKQAASIAKGLLLDAVKIYDSCPQHYVHTDLKVENCMYVSNADGLRVVLIDFGGFSPEGGPAGSFSNLPHEVMLDKPRLVRGSPVTTQGLFTYALAVMVLQLCSKDFASYYSLVDTAFKTAFFSGNPMPPRPFSTLMLAAALGTAELEAVLALSRAKTFQEGLAAIQSLDAGCLKTEVPAPLTKPTRLQRLQNFVRA
jgi:hypothetical protein